MINKPIFVHHSQKNLHFKDYLDAVRSPPKAREEKQPKNRKYLPQVNYSMKMESQAETGQLVQLRKRYGELQCNYKQLLQKVKTKNVEHERLKEQIKIYQMMHVKDTEQIERLRCIIGLINRKTVETQVSEEELEWNNFNRNSRSNKFDQSTEDDIKFRQTKEAFSSKEKQTSKSPKTRERGIIDTNSVLKSKPQREQDSILPIESPKGMLQQYQKQLRRAIESKKRLSNSPYSQLRFVPKDLKQ